MALAAVIVAHQAMAISVDWLPLALILPFAGVVVIRGLALWHALTSSPAPTPIRVGRSGPESSLPSYTILVPLYREREVVPHLVASLAALDYPAHKLQILFLTEATDTPTRRALLAAHLRGHMAVVTVPEGLPRTKPRALNHALAMATGEYVVVYDAEDEPEPDQLRRAAAAFRCGGQGLGCLQAQLKIYNARQCWLTAQFAIEYAVLFGLVLPALQRFNLPIALGGTSNHFPRQVLLSVGGWDAFNVTEDADLGLRLARLGWQVGTLPSATFEEAPSSLRAWFGQRRRWLKGWLQTALVLTRHPWRLWCQLGTRRFLAVHLLLAGMLLSALVHPIYLAILAYALCLSDSTMASTMWWMGLAVFVAGYGVSISLAAIAAARSPHRGCLMRHILGIPLYWLLISLAAYAALWEYARRPFHWNKTPHRGRASSP